MGPIRNLDKIKVQAYQQFAGANNIVTKTVARIPVFFLSIIALFNEIALGIHSRPLNASVYDPSVPDSTTQRTQAVSMEIFSLLWRVPKSSEVAAAQKLSACAPVAKELLGKIKDIKMKINSDDLLSHLEPLQESEVKEALKTSDAVNELGQFDYEEVLARRSMDHPTSSLRTLVVQTHVDLDHLSRPIDRKRPDTEKVITETELNQAKMFLKDRYKTTSLSLSLINAIPDTQESQGIKTILKKILFDQIGTPTELRNDLVITHKALKLIRQDQLDPKSPLYKKGLGFEMIKTFEEGLLKKAITPHQKLEAQKMRVTLERYLTKTLFTQINKDMNRRDFTLKIEGESLSFQSQVKTKKAIPQDLWGFHLYSKLRDALDHIHYESPTDNAFQALTAIYSYTQTLDGEMARRNQPLLDTTLNKAQEDNPGLLNDVFLIGNLGEVKYPGLSEVKDKIEMTLNRDGRILYRADYDRRLSFFHETSDKKLDYITRFDVRGTIGLDTLDLLVTNSGLEHQRVTNP